MMKAVGAMLVAVVVGAVVLSAGSSWAQNASPGLRTAQAEPINPPVRRVPRLRIYPNTDTVHEVFPRFYPGPNAVRQCSAAYVQEYRPSGTVIVPRMHCVWRQG